MKSLPHYTPEARLNGQFGRVSLPVAAACLLGFALVLRAGVPLWQALVPAQAPGQAEASPNPAETAHKPDLAALQALALFDSGTAPGTVADANAIPGVNTTLDLRLEGIILAGDGNNSMAVIVSGGKQGTYRSGATLPAGANVLVAEIARDHVVIDNRGQREVLWLFGGQEAATATAGTTGMALPPGTDARVLKTAARLAEIISVEPAIENGAVVGYRLSPGMRLKDFVQLGFETNDIVTAVNGLALDNPANLPQLYSLMDGATEVSFSLLRDGAPLSLKVTLSPEVTSNQ